MGLFKKLHDKLFEDERVPPPPAPGHKSAPAHTPDIGVPPPLPSQHPVFAAEKPVPEGASTTPDLPSEDEVPKVPVMPTYDVPEKTAVVEKTPVQPPVEKQPPKEQSVSTPKESENVSQPQPAVSKTHGSEEKHSAPEFLLPPEIDTHKSQSLPSVPGLSPRTLSTRPPEPSQIKAHPAHDTPFFSQKPVELSANTDQSTPEPSVTLPTPAPVIQNSEPKTPAPALPPQEAVVEVKHEAPKLSQPPTFHLVDGRVIAGPSSLAMVAEDMSDDVFSHHVSDEKNDFATWIRHGLGDEQLAEKVLLAHSASELSKVLRAHHGTSITPSSSEPLPEIESVDLSSLKEAFDSIAEKLASAAAMKSSVEEQQAAIEARESDLSAREEAFAQSLADFESEKQKTQQALLETARLRDELRKRHVELAELALALDAEQDRLRHNAKRHSDQQLSHDIREDSFEKVAVAPAPEVPSADAHAVLDVVERAHHALVDEQVAEARRLYSEARELFYSTNLPEDERRELYNLIRELYTDIELTRMN